MKSFYKKQKIIPILVILFFIFSIPSYAVPTQGTDASSSSSTSQSQSHTAGEIISKGDSFIDIGQSQGPVIQKDNMQDMSNSLYNILLVAGIIVAVAVGGVLGIKFMLGSVETQADVKNMLLPYITGCVVVFGAFIIWKVVLLIVQ